MTQPRTRMIATCAVLAALLGASAYVALPTPWGVPFTMQVLVVLLAGLLLPPGWAAAAVGVYLALGAAGVPVFSGPSGGLGVFAGNTGGYLIGFGLAAPLVAAVRGSFGRRSPTAVADAAAAVAGLVVIYLLGWAQLGAVTGLGPARAFVLGVVPFLPADALKAAIAVTLAAALRRAGVVRALGARA